MHLGYDQRVKTLLWIALWLASFSAPAGAAPRILVIGDSHTAGGFGRALDQELWDAGVPAEVHALPGATANWFFTGENHGNGAAFHHDIETGKVTRPTHQAAPKLPELLLKVHPAFTVVALGSNFEWLDKTPLTAEIARVMKAVREADSKCIWIGPPDMNTVPESLRIRFYRILSETAAAESCSVIDSFKILGKHPSCTGAKGPCDPIHWDGYPARAKAWGHEVGQQILRIAIPSAP
jgi:hypothetical protein